MTSPAKAKLSWNEPRSIRRAREGALRRAGAWKGKLVVVAIVAGVVMGQWALALRRADRTPPAWYVALALGLLLGGFLVYLVPLILKLCPSRITLTPQGILQLVGNRRALLPWRHVRAAGIDEVGRHRCLRLALAGGADEEEMVYGLDGKVDGDAVLAFVVTRLAEGQAEL